MDGADDTKAQQVSQAKAPSWEERFVQSHSPANQAKQPIDMAFWKDVEIVADGVLLKANPSGNVSKDDLAKTIESGKLKGDQAQVGAALYHNFDNLKSESSFLSFGTSIINKASIADLSARAIKGENEFNKVDNLVFWADDQGNLKKLSPNGSGTMSYDNIQSAEKRNDLSNTDRAMLSELSANYFSIAKNGGIGKSQIDDMYTNFTKSDKDFRLSDAMQRDMQWVQKNQENPNAHKLYADASKPLESIKPDSVIMSFGDDCAFKAALAGLAAARPQDIAGMIRPSSEAGHFDVHLPGEKNKTFNVSQPTDEELGLFANGNRSAQGGYWPTVITKAFGQDAKDHQNPVMSYFSGARTVDEWAGADGDESKAIEALTGHKVNMSGVASLNDAELSRSLEEAQSGHRVIVLTTGSGSGNTADGFKQEHAFTVTNVSKDGAGVKVTVRDPRAIGGNNHPDGTMTIPLQTLRKNFTTLYLETNNPL